MILLGSPLHNPFKAGHRNCITLAPLRTKEDTQQAYSDWLLAQIKLQNPVVIQALDEIAYASLDGEVTLDCSCNHPACHGYIIKEIIDEATTPI